MKKIRTYGYFNRKFEYEDMLQDFYWPWAGHKYFSYDLVRNIKPKIIVELGVHKGTSFFSFSQAVKDECYYASLYAVDTWRGDEHAGFYDDNVFKEVKEIKDKYFGELKIKLLQKTFDEAVGEFENNSIDLLHIDGLHTYTAVKHDFEKWFPKVKKEGIILLHDIFISRDDFGVYKFWEELKSEYKTIEFHHSYGLGVLFKGSDRYQTFIDKEREWQIKYSCIAEDKRNENVRTSLNNLEKSLEELDRQIANLNQTLAEAEALKASLAEKEAALNNIYNSHGWKVLTIYYRVGNKIFPLNTKRRLFATLVFRTITNPKKILRNLNKKNVEKFLYYFRTADPAIIEEKIGRKILAKSELVQTEPLKIEFQKNITLGKIEGLNFPYYEQPLVSIIIPVWDKWKYTYNCLKSILKNTNAVPYEIIIANDASTDETSAMLTKVKGINIIDNQANLGFLKNCNNAVRYSKGKYILFLNNDTEVKEMWLSNLVKIAERDDSIGVVGGKLLYPDGRLQEAGSIMDRDGWGQPYGRSGDPNRYEYNYVKETDFITGACLLVRKDVFLKIGGFDEIYTPAFYEEFDLEFAIREAGYKIMYQPKAVIIHHDASSYGVETRNSFSVINHAKFIEKWKNQINGQIEHSDIFLARDRSKNKKVLLFVDLEVDYDKHAGSLSTYQYIRLLHEMGFKVIFISDLLMPLEPYTTELQQLGIEVVYGQFEFKSWFQQNGRHIDYVWLARPDVAIKYIRAIKRYAKSKILYFTHDLHYLRELRRYQIEKRKEILDESKRLKEIEFYLFKNVDVILTPSDQEQKIIKEAFPEKRIVTMPVIYYGAESIDERLPNGFDGRPGVLFLGGFEHLPNVDAIKWFIEDIYPHIRRELGDVKFYIVGSNPPPEIMILNSTDVIVTGYVKELSPLFEKCRIFVSPLRYGAGVKGKIVTSMYYGVPVVTTSVGNEGLNLRNGVEALIADDPIEFANRTVELYTNAKMWTTLSKNSITFVKNNFSKDKAKHVMLETFEIIRTK